MNLFTSDTHLNHRKIIQYCKRPFEDVMEMNAGLIENWNARVGKDDNVYHLGDFAFASPEKVEALVGELNGHIHLIRGNHDDDKVFGLPIWASAQTYAEIKVDGALICLSHYAMRAWNGAYKGSYMFYGHTHNNLGPINRSIDVGVDYPAWNYGPVTFKEIKTHLASIGLDEVPVFPPREGA